MLSHDLLAALVRELRDRRVLSVYVEHSPVDPAARRARRVRLEKRIAELRSRIARRSAAEADSFERCVSLLNESLGRVEPSPGGPGWAAFITPDGVRHADTLPVVPAMRVAWGTGMLVSPYLRSLKQATPVVVALVDADQATLYRWWMQRLEPQEPLHAAHTVAAGHAHMGRAPRPGFHAGVRGATGRDEAQRAQDVATGHMLAAATEQALRLAGRDGWILVGGIPRVRARLTRSLQDQAPGHVLDLEHLDVHATGAMIADAACTGASAIRNASDESSVAELIDHSAAHGRATLGPETTRRALELGRVRDLYITQRYLDTHESDAEHAVRHAFDRGARVEVVGGGAATRLDAFGGLGAWLKYAEPQAVA